MHRVVHYSSRNFVETQVALFCNKHVFCKNSNFYHYCIKWLLQWQCECLAYIIAIDRIRRQHANLIILPWVLCLVPRVYVMQLLSTEVSKVNDSTGNLIRPLWFYLFSRVCTVVNRVNVWKPSLLPTLARYHASKVLHWHYSCKQNPRSYLNIDISSSKEIHISNLCKHKPQGTNNNSGTKL